MTDERIRIKIAEACGWKLVNGYLCQNGIRVLQVGTLNDSWEKCWQQVFHIIPNYLGDLDACHEMEEILLVDADARGYSNIFHQYSIEIHKMALPMGMHPCYAAVRATARQRCEAFLRTMNLWEEEKQACKHSWGDVVVRGTIGCKFCKERKQVSKTYERQLNEATRMEANYQYRDEH